MGEWFFMKLYRFHRKTGKGSNKISRFLIFLLFAFIFTVLLYTYIENKLTPIVKTIALTRANAIASGAISEVVNNELDIDISHVCDMIDY
jgi:peptidoglycan/LPS O-acetylase OafA/YrhL